MDLVTKDPLPPASDPAPGLEIDLEGLRISRGDGADLGRRSSSSPRWPLLVLLLLLAAVVVAAVIHGDAPSAAESTPTMAPPVSSTPPPPETPAAPRARKTGFSAAGWVKLPLYHPVHVTPLVEGRVEEILVVEGDPVRAGQVIARLYRRDYEALLDVARAQVQAAQATYQKMQAGYRKQEVAEARAEAEGLEAELRNANEILRHSRELHPSGAIPLEELQVDETRVQTLQARLARARERLALLEEGYRTEDVALSLAALEKARAEHHLARLRLEYTEIKSPMTGVVLERKASRGQWLDPQKGTVVDVYDPLDLEARVDVNQNDVSRVFVGQQVDVTTRAEPGKVHSGKVVLIEPKADLVKNTVPVRVKLIGTDAESLLYPDMVVTARFLTPEQEEGAEAPAAER